MQASESSPYFFNECLLADGPRLKATVGWVINRLDAVASRKRQRRADDQRRHEHLIEVIVANLAHASLLKLRPSVAVVLSNNAASSRPRRSEMRQLPSAIRALEAAGLITTVAARRPGYSGTFEPTPLLTAEFASLKFSDFRRHTDEEVLKVHWSRYERRGGGYPSRERDKVPIGEGLESRALRKQVWALNAHLAAADIGIAGSAEARRIDSFDRRLHRHFTILHPGDPQFALNGRLFGGFWQTLPTAERHLIRIDGEGIADLDYQSLFVRLAYCRLGIEPPEGDLYDLPGFEPCWRAGIKQLFSAFLFAPVGRRTIPLELRNSLPNGLTAKGAREAILARHPRLEPILETGAGFSFMKTESEILIAALESLFDAGIAALPMHDGLLLARSRTFEGQEAMTAASKSVVGVELPVIVRSDTRHSREPADHRTASSVASTKWEKEIWG